VRGKNDKSRRPWKGDGFMVVDLAKAAGFSGALPLRNGAMFAADHCAMIAPRTAVQTRAPVAL